MPILEAHIGRELDRAAALPAAGIAAKNNFTDKDIVDFLTNVECLEGLFDTWGTFGRGFTGDLALGGPTPRGARQARLSPDVLPYLQEVAPNEQARMRHDLCSWRPSRICPTLLLRSSRKPTSSAAARRAQATHTDSVLSCSAVSISKGGGNCLVLRIGT